MKKLFSILAALALVISLSACTEDLQPKITELETKITELETQVTGLESQITTLEGDKTTLETSEASLLAEKAALEAQIQELQDLIFDQTIVLTLKNTDDSLVKKSVGFNDDFDGTLFDLLDETFAVTATESEYGHYITAIEDLQPTNGAYIALLKNGVMSSVGVDAVSFEDGDVFTFEVQFWDMTEKAVFDGINLFLEEQADSYVNATTIDYSVMAALAHLGLEEEYVSDAEVQAYVDGLTLSTGTEYFKAIVILEAAGLDSSSLKVALNDIAAPAGYGGTGYQLQALNSGETTVDSSTFETAALADLAATTPADLGIDSGAITILALSNYIDEDGVDQLITDWVTYIKDNQLESGAILPKDFGWGSTENAATMAQAVIGLVAAGVNPKGSDATLTDMSVLNYNLIDSLCGYQNEDGSFNWVLSSEDPDRAFSTPQAFLALSVYYSYSNSFNTAVNAYDFN